MSRAQCNRTRNEAVVLKPVQLVRSFVLPTETDRATCHRLIVLHCFAILQDRSKNGKEIMETEKNKALKFIHGVSKRMSKKYEAKFTN